MKKGRRDDPSRFDPGPRDKASRPLCTGSWKKELDQEFEQIRDYSDLIARLHARKHRAALRQKLDALRTAYLEGDTAWPLLEAIFLCSEWSLKMPGWLTWHFGVLFERFKRFGASSSDDVFGAPLPKGTHWRSAIMRARLRHHVYLRVKEILQTKPIDQTLEDVAEENKISRTLCAELYYGFDDKLAILCTDQFGELFFADFSAGVRAKRKSAPEAGFREIGNSHGKTSDAHSAIATSSSRRRRSAQGSRGNASNPQTSRPDRQAAEDHPSPRRPTKNGAGSLDDLPTNGRRQISKADRPGRALSRLDRI
jgi:hypothetical protein